MVLVLAVKIVMFIWTISWQYSVMIKKKLINDNNKIGIYWITYIDMFAFLFLFIIHMAGG